MAIFSWTSFFYFLWRKQRKDAQAYYLSHANESRSWCQWEWTRLYTQGREREIDLAFEEVAANSRRMALEKAIDIGKSHAKLVPLSVSFDCRWNEETISELSSPTCPSSLAPHVPVV